MIEPGRFARFRWFREKEAVRKAGLWLREVGELRLPSQGSAARSESPARALAVGRAGDGSALGQYWVLRGEESRSTPLSAGKREPSELAVQTILQQALLAERPSGASSGGDESFALRVDLFEPFPEENKASGLLEVRAFSGEQTNSNFSIGKTAVLKLYRKLEGVESECDSGSSLEEWRSELGRAQVEFLILSELRRLSFFEVPRLLGVLSWQRSSEVGCFGLLLERLENSGSLWEHASDELSSRYSELSPQAKEGRRGTTRRFAFELGSLVGRLHAALRESSLPEFRPKFPEERARLLRRAQLLRLHEDAFDALEASVGSFQSVERAKEKSVEETRAQELSLEVLSLRSEVKEALVRGAGVTTERPWQRIHGDLHLGQVLVCGEQLRLIDFEGEPGRSPEERRGLKSPLVDLAGVIRSFDYAAAHHAFVSPAVQGGVEGDSELSVWRDGCVAEFLSGYGFEPEGAGYSELRSLILEKALYELLYEIRNRPSWRAIPLVGLLRLIRERSDSEVPPSL